MMIALVARACRGEMRAFFTLGLSSPGVFSRRLLKISDDGEIFWCDSVNYKRACFFFPFFFFFKPRAAFISSGGKVRRVSGRSK